MPKHGSLLGNMELMISCSDFPVCNLKRSVRK